MGYVVQTTLPTAEPVVLADAKSYLRLPSSFTDDDTLITGMIQAAREHAETITGRGIAQRTFRQVLDSFPYYTDTVQSQLAYPPSYYSLPRYSTTLWNYSQMIKLAYPPCISIAGMRYIDTNGEAQTLEQDTDFILDRITEPARIFPIPGSYWPANQYVANALEIDFTSGYDPDPTHVDTHDVEQNPPNQQPDSIMVTGIPQGLRMLIMRIVSDMYDHRWDDDKVRSDIDNKLWTYAVVDFQPTRG